MSVLNIFSSSEVLLLRFELYLTISKLETSFLNLCFFLCSFHGVHEEGTKAIDGITNVLPKWK